MILLAFNQISSETSVANWLLKYAATRWNVRKIIAKLVGWIANLNGYSS